MNAVVFDVSANAAGSVFHHVWEHTVGSGHATLALRADWQTQLRRCHEHLGFRRVRFHGIFDDDMGTLVEERGKALYAFSNVDRIFDFLVSIGMEPYVELSFMPRMLASGSKTVFHYAANVTPPRRVGAWGELVRRFARHLVERYGIGEVGRWYFEVWNEPNLSAFWSGTRKDYFALYRETARALKSVDASLRVGGPATAQSAWVGELVEFCERTRTALDFVSTHYYPTDALGSASTNTTEQLARAPRHVMRARATEVRDRAGGRPLVYSEWSTTSNPNDPRHDDARGAVSAARIALDVADVVDGYSYWTFSDVFEENYFPARPFHGGFGLLTLDGVAKPAYRAFELLHRLGHEKLRVAGHHRTVSLTAVRGSGELTLVVINDERPRHPIRSENVRIAIHGAARPRSVMVRRIGNDPDPRGAWKAIGAPDSLSPLELATVEEASRVHASHQRVTERDGVLHLDLAVPPHTMAFVSIE
jgi:xylan 1,4-beta-xylosidase